MWKITKKDGNSVGFINNSALLLYLTLSSDDDFDGIVKIERCEDEQETT